jgi:hypothetical protein
MTKRPTRAVRLVAAMNIVAIVALYLCAFGVAQEAKRGSAVLLTPLPVMLITLLLLYMWRGAPVLPRPRFLTATLLAVPFVLWWQYGLVAEIRDADNGGVPIMIIFTFGFYVVALATHMILASSHGTRTELAMTCAVMGMGMAGASTSNLSQSPGNWTMPVYLTCLVLFIPLLLWTMRAHQVDDSQSLSRRCSRWVIPIVLLAVGAVLGQMGLVAAAERGNEALRDWAAKVIARKSMGAHDVQTRRIGSIEDIWAQGPPEQVMLRVFGASPGQYLRGSVFDTYNPRTRESAGTGAWTIRPPKGRPTESPLNSYGRFRGRNMFKLRAHTSETPQAVVYPSDPASGNFFLPLNVHQVAAYTHEARYWPHLQTMRPATTAAGGYIYFEPVTEPPHPQASTSESIVPPKIRNALATFVSQKLAPDAAQLSKQQKINRIVEYFQENYDYQLGQKFTSDQDPIIEFINDKKHGHCEYFASSAVLLLRSMGIPARYVTGFVCREKGLGSDLWIVRRRDAHAWVEAYLSDQKKWVVVEATPPDSGPPPTSAGDWDRFADWLGSWWERFARTFSYGGFTGLVANAWAMILAWMVATPLWLWFGVILFGLIWTFRRSLRRRMRRAVRRPVTERVTALRKKLRRAERLLGGYGMHLKPNQTVHHLLIAVETAQLPEPVRQEVTQILIEYQTLRFTVERSADLDTAGHAVA